MLVEQWLPVVGFEGRYEVSNLGRLRSLAFRSNGAAEIMKLTPNYSGYLVVTLGAERKQRRVHNLVLEAFVGPRPPGMQGCHNDNNRQNNNLSNLRWDTPKGNISDRRRYFGEANPRSKLTDSQTEEIREHYRLGLPTKSLAELYGVTPTRIRQICKV